MANVIDLFDRPVALQEILEDLPVGVIVLDSKRRVILSNKAADILSGLDGTQGRGLPCRHVLRASLCLRDCPATAAEQDGPVCREGDLISRNRCKIPIRITSVALRDSEQNLLGFLESIEDLSNRRQPESADGPSFSFGKIIGRSRVMDELFRMVPMISQTDSSVLLTGETGTGKDLLAEAIHEASGRSDGPFIKVNCGALPESLLESELFGHAKGAFTGALEKKPGRIRLAHNGTLYLTEIGDLPFLLQVKLLSFLDDKVVHPLGSTRSFSVDVRIIAATHRDLQQMVRDGDFREDLLYRLNVVRLHLPPLRDRDQDLLLLLDHFLQFFATRFGKQISGYTSRAREFLTTYAFPGNVRELRNIIEYATNVCGGQLIDLEHLPSFLLHTAPVPAPLQAGLDAPLEARGPTFVGSVRRWEDVERQLILDALVEARGRRGKAAGLLGWGRSTLWRKMKKHGISEDTDSG